MSQTLKVNAARDLESARNVIQLGGVIAFPTDTFYGLGVDPFNSKAVDKIFKIKGRDEKKPLLLLIGSVSQLKPLVKTVNVAHLALMKKYWPGRLTLLFEPGSFVPKNVSAGTNRIGFRQPGNTMTLDLISALGTPITGTSANPSGESPPTTPKQVQRILGNDVDLIIDGGTCPGGKPSTLVDIVKSPIQLIRDGAIPFQDIEDTLNDLKQHPQPEVP